MVYICGIKDLKPKDLLWSGTASKKGMIFDITNSFSEIIRKNSKQHILFTDQSQIFFQVDV